MSAPTPALWSRPRYLLGRPLGAKYTDWVTNDLTGPGASQRYFLRGLVWLTPIWLICLLIPGPVGVRLGMAALLTLPLIYFQLALRTVYVRHLLRSNGIDPALWITGPERHRQKRAEQYRWNP